MVVKKEYLLSTLWTQYDKVIGCGNNENLENGIEFNQYTPLDLFAAEKPRSYTGCAITADAQIIYYYLQNDAWDHTLSYDIKLDVLTENDAFVSFANIPELTLFISADGGGAADTLSFAEINDKLSVFVPAPTDPEAEDYDSKSLAAADYIAALNFSIGVLHQAAYSNFFGTAAGFSADIFLRCGFKSAAFIDLSEDEKTANNLWKTEDKKLTAEALEILIDNLNQGKPITFGLTDHAIVLDGYDSDSDMFHLNYGWGSDSEETKWYTREEFLAMESLGFVIDISPVYQETFTVTDSRVFGSGTLMRAVQQAAAMQGDNTITFDAALAESDALELPIELELKDNVTIDGFNMTLFGSDQKSEEGDVENQNADEGEKEEEQSNLALFFGETGNRTEFKNFSGNLVCSFQEKTKGAAIYFTEAVQLTVSTSNATIYAGVSQFENADILEKIKSGSVEELLEDSSKKTAIAGSDGDDKIEFADGTLVIGNLELSGGHDSLTVTSNSTLYGDIDVGSGDNTVTISGGASIYGNLLGEAKLNISLGSIFHITGDAESTFENLVSITIDASNAEENEYVLFNTGNIDLLLEKIQIEGGGGIIAEPDGTIKWVAENGYTPEAGEGEEEQITETIVQNGEMIENGSVAAGNVLIFKDGSIATGSLTIDEDGEVKVETGAKFIFDISSMSEDNKNCLISNYAGINGTFHFAVNMAADQAEGSYILAENVTEWDFHTPIVVTAGELKLGTFENSEAEKKLSFTYDDTHYSLAYDEEQKTLTLVVDSPFQTTVNEDNSIELSWNKPVGATGYFLNISRSDENGSIEIFSEKNSLNIVTAATGEYEWKVITPGLETEYRDGGTFSGGTSNATSTLYDAGEDDKIVDVFMAKSSGTWGGGYIAKHVELPENISEDSKVCTQVVLKGKNRYEDIFQGAEGDVALLYLSDSANGDALFLDDVYSAFPDSNKIGRLSSITGIYAGAGDDVIDLTTDKFTFSSEELRVFGGEGNDVIWAGAETSAWFFGDEGDDCLVGASKNDNFVGGSGDDVMYGGGGADKIYYGDPSTWGNDTIYQLDGDAHSVELVFSQAELEGKVLEEDFEGGTRFYLNDYENSCITLYGHRYILTYGKDEEEDLEKIIECGGCGEHATQNIFENKTEGMLA